MSSATSGNAASCACMGPPGDCPCIRRMRELAPQPYQPMYAGWACPKCNSIYGPNQAECWRCNPPPTYTVTCATGS